MSAKQQQPFRTFEQQICDITSLLFADTKSQDPIKDREDRIIILLHDLYECEQNIRATKQILDEELVKKKLINEILVVLLSKGS